jgi:hypothetical protein
MTLIHPAREACPLGGTHALTHPIHWTGESCWKCHKTWEGTELAPTWPNDRREAPGPDDGPGNPSSPTRPQTEERE